MIHRIAPLALAVMLATACSGEPDDKRATCARLLDHMANLAVERSGARLSPEEQDKHRASLVASSGDEFVKECVEKWRSQDLECGLAAQTEEDARRCRRVR